jgi:glutathione S-transferase
MRETSGSTAASDVTLFSRPISTFGLVAEIALVEKGVAFQRVDVETTSSEHRARHPFGKIPVLEHCNAGAVVRIVESLAVTRYIDDAFVGPALQPADAVAVARMTQWIAIVVSYLFPTMTGGITKPLLFDAASTSEASVAAALVEADRQLELIDEALAANRWLAGAQFTLADVFAFPVLAGLEFTAAGAALLGDHERTSRWLEEMKARPSVRTTGLVARG